MANSRYVIHEYNLSPVQVLVRLTQMLCEGETLTTCGIARRFGINTRNAQRHIDTISLAIPLYEWEDEMCVPHFKLLATKNQRNVS